MPTTARAAIAVIGIDIEKNGLMTETAVSHFRNDLCSPVIEIGSLSRAMGSDHEIICSYSTLDPKLDPFEQRPLQCAMREAIAA
jgi:hypothetical protein